MKFNDFMVKIRQLDNQVARWIMRHFYVVFFQIVLFIIFLFWFVNMFNVIDAKYMASENRMIEKILAAQAVNTTIIVFLILLNSFWTLFIFSSMQNLRSILKNIDFHISRLRTRNKNS